MVGIDFYLQSVFLSLTSPPLFFIVNYFFFVLELQNMDLFLNIVAADLQESSRSITPNLGVPLFLTDVCVCVSVSILDSVLKMRFVLGRGRIG